MTNSPIAGNQPFRTLVLGSALVVATLLAACSAKDDAGSDPLAVSCANIEALDSYRYTINVKLKVAENPTSTTSPQTSPGAFADDLNALLSDFTIDGAYIAPDHTTAILRFQEDEVELRAIGNESWERLGTTWQPREDPIDDIALLTPDVVCNDTVRGTSSVTR